MRQLWDFKGQGDPMVMELEHLSHYGALCAWILARAHARTGDAVQISAYLGASGDASIAPSPSSRQRYAKTNEQDHAALLDAIASGRIEAQAI